MLLFIIHSINAEEPSLEDCKCWAGYEPQKNKDGQAECHGTFLLTIRPCNVPEPPQCKCSGEVNGILNDGTGTYCSYRVKGEEVKKWKCENEDEWKKYEEDLKQYNETHKKEEVAEEVAKEEPVKEEAPKE